MKFCVLSVLLTLTCTLATAADPVVYERVIGTEFPGKYKHPASIEELDNGDLYIAYYGGDGEYAEVTAVYGMRKAKGESTWSQPKIIADTPFYSDGNAVIWQAPDKVVWLFYVCRFGDTWSTSRIKAKLSHDGARTWSDSFFVALDEGMMVRSRPLLLADGDYLLPVYHETGFDTEKVGADSTSLFLRFSPKTKKWTRSEPIRSPKGNIQPSVVQLSSNHLIAYCRRGGGYGPGTEGFVIRSESRDGGRTWSEGRDSQFPNPNAAIDFLKLTNGHLLLVYNNSPLERTPLTVAISTDEDKSWPVRRDIATGNHDYGYPYAIQARDGKVHIVYTSDKRSTINHAVLDEAAVLAEQKK
ncbi:MAG TPA: sialidase family protein [Pirellulales bacterium]|jgi:predicted neuraminidase|nr:sialidase family protein [Pirellulales bacterium]